MKIKKIICSTLIVSSLITSGTLSFADSSSELGKLTNKTIVDLSPVAEKSTPSKSLDTETPFNIRSAYTVTSRIRCQSGIIKAIASSSVTRSIDYVSARSRVYNSNGSLNESDFDSMKNSSYVSATATPSGLTSWGKWALGNHEYRDAGYYTINHETRDSW